MEISNRIENWFTQGYNEPRVKDYFLINTSWWQLAIFLSVYNLAAAYGPAFVKKRNYDLRPYMLVLAGLQFGVYGVGIPIMLWLTQFGTIAWECSMPQHHPFLQEVFIRLGYTYLWLKIADISTTIIMILRQKPNQNPLEHSIRNSVLLLVVFYGVKMFPKGYFMFLPSTDCLLSAFRACYYVLAAPGTAFKHHLWFKKYIYWIALLMGLLNFGHMYRHITKGCAGPSSIMFVILFHNLGEIVTSLKHIAQSGSKTHKVE